MEHTLLPKILALPVFSSDALSSVAYATEEILLVLLSVSTTAGNLTFPIAVAVSTLMVIVILSYRQTVKAYPSGGGAYIVSKENLGEGAGLVAASALLVDYMLTVVVSTVAGVVAITSAIPSLSEHRVALAIGFVTLITLANLRGVKEAGTVFAVPDVRVHPVRLHHGDGRVLPVPGGVPGGRARAAVAGARHRGGHGDPLVHPARLLVGIHGAHRRRGHLERGAGLPPPPGAQRVDNARDDGRDRDHDVPRRSRSWPPTSTASRPARNARSWGRSPSPSSNGGVFFYIVQGFTAAILILAANTAYQDFPRLSAILARDRYMPRQFMNRGDRLVFSNGVIGLWLASIIVIYAFDADLTKLIQMYVVGVFTSFTLSQTGMVRHWRAEARKGADAYPKWRSAMVVNAIGGSTTAIVLVVVTATKFAKGAWLSILVMIAIVPVLRTIHRHYTAVAAQLQRGTVRPGEYGANHVVLLVQHLDAATAEALGYIRSFRPANLHVVYPASHGAVPPEMVDAWRGFAGDAPDLEPLTGRGDLRRQVRAFVRDLDRAPADFVTVVVPEEVRGGLSAYVLRNRMLIRLKNSLLREPNVVVTDVPVVTRDCGPDGVDARPLIPLRTVTLVFVSNVNEVTIARRQLRAIDRRRRDPGDLLRPGPRRSARARTAVVRRAHGDPARHRGGAVPRPDRTDAR